jgi:hypothetical protein
MNTIGARIAWILCLGMGVPAMPAALAQESKPASQTSEPGVHRLEIYNGPLHSVYYYAAGASPGELAGFRNAAYAQKQAELAGQLLDLRNQYVNDERVLESRRRTVQQQWYGYANQYSPGYGAPYYGYGGYGYPWLGSGYPFLGFGNVTASNNLAFGVGDEGPIKDQLARTLAGQATPEFAAMAGQHLDTALARVGGPANRDLARGAPEKTGIAPAGYETTPADGFRLASPGAHVIVTSKVGDTIDKVDGTLVRENSDWIVVKTAAGNRTIPKRQVVDILEPGGTASPPSKP